MVQLVYLQKNDNVSETTILADDVITNQVNHNEKEAIHVVLPQDIPHNEASNLHAFIERCFMVHTALTRFELFTIKLHILGWLQHAFLLENTIST